MLVGLLQQLANDVQVSILYVWIEVQNGAKQWKLEGLTIGSGGDQNQALHLQTIPLHLPWDAEGDHDGKHGLSDCYCYGSRFLKNAVII